MLVVRKDLVQSDNGLFQNLSVATCFIGLLVDSDHAMTVFPGNTLTSVGSACPATDLLLDIERRMSERSLDCFTAYPTTVRDEFLHYWFSRFDKGEMSMPSYAYLSLPLPF